jgi:hypothetical protein
VIASFDRLSYQVTAVAGAGGTVTPTEQTVFYGDVAVVEVQPEEGYRIDQVSGCGGSLNGGYYASAEVFAACEISATFAEIPAIDTDSILTLTGQALDLDISHGLISIDGVSSTLYETKINSDGSFQIELQAESLAQSPNRLRVRLEGISSYGHEIGLTTSLPSVQELWSQFGSSVTTTELLELKVSTISTSLDAYAVAIAGTSDLTTAEYIQTLSNISASSLTSHMAVAELVYTLGYTILPQDKADLFDLLQDPIRAHQVLNLDNTGSYYSLTMRIFEEKMTHYRRGRLQGEYYDFDTSNLYPRISVSYLAITPEELRYVSSADETKNVGSAAPYDYRVVNNGYRIKTTDYVGDALIETSCSVPTAKLFDDPSILLTLPPNLMVTCSTGLYEIAPVLALQHNTLVTATLYQYIQPQRMYVSGMEIDIPERLLFSHSLRRFEPLPDDVVAGDQAIVFDPSSLFLLPKAGPQLTGAVLQLLGRLEADGTVLGIIDAASSLPNQEGLIALGHNQIIATWELEESGRVLRLRYSDGGQQALIQKLSLDDHDLQYLVSYINQSGELTHRFVLTLGPVLAQNLAELLISYSNDGYYLRQKAQNSFVGNLAGWFAFKFSEVGAGTYVKYCDGAPVYIDALCRGIASVGLNSAFTSVVASEGLLMAIRSTSFVKNYRSFRVLSAEGNSLMVFQQLLTEFDGNYLPVSVSQRIIILERVSEE